MEPSERAKKVLSDMDDILVAGNGHQATAQEEYDATFLWNVYTALRGPDNTSSAAKEATIHVRRGAFPRLAKLLDSRYIDHASFSNGPSFSGYASLESAVEYAKSSGREHFFDHIRRALTALGVTNELF